MELDDKDQKILDVLTQNSKLSTQKIAKRLNIPITTVHNRIKKLEKEGFIKNYTVSLDYGKLGKGVTAFVLITVDYKLLKITKGTQTDLAKRIKAFPTVDETCIVAGGTDIIIKVRAKDIAELSQFVTKDLRNMDGVEKTETVVVLSEA
jgi:Lrp/AsnC family transcriptional regulator, leucine-responsive regulatory protein